MLKFLKIIVLINFLNLKIFACALCALYTPTAHVSFMGKSIKWEFSSNFSQTLLDGFDKNNDKKLDGKELIEIRVNLLDYLIPKNFLTSLKYYDLPLGETQKINFNVKNVNVKFDKVLFLEYDLDYDFTPQIDRVLVFNIKDEDGFFNFLIKENTYKLDNFIIDENINLNAAYYQIVSNKTQIKDKKQIIKIVQKETNNELIQSLKKIYKNILDFLVLLQEKLILLLKENNILFYPLALIYGFLHALLPSHGKTLSASYFMNSKRKIIGFALKVGFFHLISAFIISSFLSIFDLLNLGRISGLLISFLALILLYIKIHKIKTTKITQSNNITNLKNFSIKKQDSKILKIIKSPNTLDNFSAFIIGLMPCPGLILVLGLLSSLGAKAFICAILIALGMSLAIFLSAFIVTRFTFSKKIEILSLVFVFFLGLFIGLSQ
ncbi:hypothetical protein [Campylobacter sp. MG1]|uniref:hypothetical protein n=1 Tax=Campylobacter sp. MG1 TaxID=2976332 RepID=UPI00226D3156|nr:hypothetical protein [Campylobacter sp. MG1]